MSVIALVPARAGSKGIPGKNFRCLGDKPLYMHAVRCAEQVADAVYVTSDAASMGFWPEHWLLRPPELAQDDTPMIAVVQHALSCIPGSSEDIWLLLQPTQPFRQPKHLRAAIELLEQTGADSVVSVVELPKTHSPDSVCYLRDYGGLAPWYGWWGASGLAQRRQDARTAYKRDGTVYAFRRRTVETYQNIYGQDVRPLIIPAEESCELDSEQDWQDVERRWAARHA